MKDGRHIIWSNDIDYDDWREDLEEQYPDLTEAERMELMCELNGDYTLKHFVKRGDEGWLVPANPDYPELKVTEDDDFSVWGTVTYIIHKPRG